jgi:hypothetical protein
VTCVVSAFVGTGRPIEAGRDRAWPTMASPGNATPWVCGRARLLGCVMGARGELSGPPRALFYPRYSRTDRSRELPGPTQLSLVEITI